MVLQLSATGIQGSGHNGCVSHLERYHSSSRIYIRLFLLKGFCRNSLESESISVPPFVPLPVQLVFLGKRRNPHKNEELVSVKLLVTLALPPSLSCALNTRARRISTKRLDTHNDVITLIVTTTYPQTRYSE
jgi:hypothetical protein